MVGVFDGFGSVTREADFVGVFVADKGLAGGGGGGGGGGAAVDEVRWLSSDSIS